MDFECIRDKYRYIRYTARFIHKEFGIDGNVSFCIDTGCINSIFMYEQAIQLKIPLHKLIKGKKPTYVAGIKADTYKLVGGILIIRPTIGKLQTVQFNPLVLSKPFPKEEKLVVPALLGDDFLSNYTLVVGSDEHGGRIYFTDKRVKTIES